MDQAHSVIALCRGDPSSRFVDLVYSVPCGLQWQELAEVLFSEIELTSKINSVWRGVSLLSVGLPEAYTSSPSLTCRDQFERDRLCTKTRQWQISGPKWIVADLSLLHPK